MLSSYGDALGGSLASNLLYSNSNTPTQTNTNRSSGQIVFSNTTVASQTSYITFGGYYKGTTTFVERMRIDSSGNVGIGTISPSSTLTLGNSTDNAAELRVLRSNSSSSTYASAGTVGGTALFKGSGDVRLQAIGGLLNLNTNGSDRMRIESDGGIFFPSLGGFSVSNSDVRYNATSDELYYQTSSKRYKSEITDLENSLDKVNNLRPVRFKDNLSQEYATGMIAEEVAEIIPEVVFTKPIDGFDEPQIEGINYSDIVPFLIKSIQELKAEIEQLKTQINN